MLAFHCDQDSCDSWQRQPVTVFDRWITVTGGDDFDRDYHFCTGNCLLLWAATWSEPTEVVPT